MTFQRKVWAFQRRFVQLNHPPPVSGGEQTRSDYRKGGTNKMVVLGMVERDTGRAREQPAKGEHKCIQERICRAQLLVLEFQFLVLALEFIQALQPTSDAPKLLLDRRARTQDWRDPLKKSTLQLLPRCLR